MKIRALVAVGLLALSAALPAGEPRIVAPDAEKLLMLDTRVIEHADNARLVLGAPDSAA